MTNFTQDDLRIALKFSPDQKIQKLADEAEVVSGSWKILAATVQLMEDGPSGGSAVMFAANKSVAIAGVAGSASGGQGVRIATFVAGAMLATAEMGIEGAKVMKEVSSPAKFGVFVTLKTAEKVIGAAGLADKHKCQLAIASLVATGGLAGLSCVATVGAMCMFGAAGVALELYNTYRQCELP